MLISTTLGLVGNESTKTGYVCIVGMLYNLPSVIQSIGRIRPSRRSTDSLVRIYTDINNQGKIRVAMADSRVAFDELVGSGVLSSECKVKYFHTMTMGSVSDWLSTDKGCRLVALTGRMGYSMDKCKICDICKDSEVSRLSLLKKKKMDGSRKEKEEGIQLLMRMRQKCICCNSPSCAGTCIVKGIRGLVCYHCIGPHRSNKCTVYKPILMGKACYSCYVFNYSQEAAHRFTDCNNEGQIKERLRAVIQKDYLDKKKERGASEYSFNQHLSGIYADEGTFFKFLYKYRDWK